MAAPSTPESVEQAWAELEAWGSERELNELDALMWRTEQHPSDSWTGVVIEMLDSAPDWERYRRGAERALSLVPRFRQRVVDPVLPVGPPVWATDRDFDLDYHVRRVQLPEPGTMRQLLDFAQALGTMPLDRERPPWVRTFVEGLEGGRAALILQAHHVLMDGAGYAQLMGRLYSPERESASVMPERAPPPPEDPNRVGLAAGQLVRRVGEAPGAAGRLVKTVGGALADPAASLRYVDSLRRVLAPPPSTTSPLLGRGSRKAWRFGVLECGLDELKIAGKAGGGSVNDAFVAALLGGLRRYHERMGVELGEIPISMPVSVRQPDDPMGGNRFAGAFFAAPAGTVEAAERIRVMRAKSEALRDEPALDFIGMLTPVMNRAPSAVVGAALRRLNATADLTLSNWPGVQHPVYVLGAEVERMFVFGPLPGTAMCAALNSHSGTCCIGLNVDGDAFEDTDALWLSMGEGLGEVLALGRTRGAPAEPAPAAKR